jgi:hypothetical protein
LNPGVENKVEKIYSDPQNKNVFIVKKY